MSDGRQKHRLPLAVLPEGVVCRSCRHLQYSKAAQLFRCANIDYGFGDYWVTDPTDRCPHYRERNNNGKPTQG